MQTFNGRILKKYTESLNDVMENCMGLLEDTDNETLVKVANLLYGGDVVEYTEDENYVTVTVNR